MQPPEPIKPLLPFSLRHVDDRHGGDKQRARVSKVVVARINMHPVDETVMVADDLEMNVGRFLEHDPTSQGAEDAVCIGTANLIITVHDSLVISWTINCFT